MKKYIKILIVSFIVIVLTGCSGNYNVEINKDLTINEELNLSIDKESDTYEKTLKIFEDNDIDESKYKVISFDDEVKIEYKEKYNSFEDYIINSKVYPQFVKNIDYNKTNKFIDIYTNENIKVKNNKTKLNGTNLNDFGAIQVNIINPFKIDMTNAEIINDNIYTWSITNETKNINIQMRFKPETNQISYKKIIVLIVLVISASVLIYNFVKRFKKGHKI